MKSFALLLASVFAVPATDLPAITSIDVYGNACAGTASAAISADPQTATIIYSAFQVSSPLQSSTVRGLQCFHNINVKPSSAGLTNSIAQFTYRGFANIPAGVTATLTTFHSFGSILNSTEIIKIKGPFEDDYTFTVPVDRYNLLNLGCSRLPPALTFVKVSLSGKNAFKSDGLVTVDSTDLAFVPNPKPAQVCFGKSY